MVGECQLVEYTVDFNAGGETDPLSVTLETQSNSGLSTRLQKVLAASAEHDRPLIRTAVAVDYNAILVNWTVSSASRARYKTVVCLQLTPSTPCVDCTEENHEVNATGSFVSALEPYSVYVIQVQAITDTGLSAVSAAVEVRTKESGREFSWYLRHQHACLCYSVVCLFFQFLVALQKSHGVSVMAGFYWSGVLRHWTIATVLLSPIKYRSD